MANSAAATVARSIVFLNVLTQPPLSGPGQAGTSAAPSRDPVIGPGFVLIRPRDFPCLKSGSASARTSLQLLAFGLTLITLAGSCLPRSFTFRVLPLFSNLLAWRLVILTLIVFDLPAAISYEAFPIIMFFAFL